MDGVSRKCKKETRSIWELISFARVSGSVLLNKRTTIQIECTYCLLSILGNPPVRNASSPFRDICTSYLLYWKPVSYWDTQSSMPLTSVGHGTPNISLLFLPGQLMCSVFISSSLAHTECNSLTAPLEHLHVLPSSSAPPYLQCFHSSPL